MTTASWTAAPQTRSMASAALHGAARLWFLVTVVGQWLFLYYIVAFYGPTILTGDFQAWSRNTMLRKGYVAGDAAGNLFFAIHVALAALVTFGGALQLVPRIRARAASFHRWNGRVFLSTAMAASLVGLYLVWVRGSGDSVAESLSITLNSVLIFVFSALAWRSARRRDMAAHRRFALRAYLVANGVWFIRIGFFAWLALSHGRYAEEFFRVWGFGSYLVPLGVLELYLRAKDRAGAVGRFAVSGALLVLTALTGVGTFAVYMGVWRPLL